eukprot:775395-Rhodomonas_salina.2
MGSNFNWRNCRINILLSIHYEHKPATLADFRNWKDSVICTSTSVGAGWVIKMIDVLAAENSIIPLFTDWNAQCDPDGMMNYTSIKFKLVCILFSKGCCRNFWAHNPLHTDNDMHECLDLLMTDLASFGYQIKE